MNQANLPAEIADLSDETALWEIINEYNWDDGFAVPLAVVRHPKCDRALALRLFWDIDETAQIHHSDEESAIAELYASTAENDPAEFDRIMGYCTTLVEGLRKQTYPRGANRFDTGFFNLEDPSLTDRQRKIRAGKTKFALKNFEEAFLQPEL
ncbi:DUF4274 domain-containing protein [Corynebacterium glutamicum]|uniref:DUF4274 domain-containing protein n=1 Tax=Corynebacterium glutamicum TaxID=1718 RepID=UPI001C6ECB80|nr:DUF4274 domain-containing protein [Corynebacterium glutamicum]QYR16825.1 DUF4274 domain-containing protein [Corynebacterium glutamicum]